MLYILFCDLHWHFFLFPLQGWMPQILTVIWLSVLKCCLVQLEAMAHLITSLSAGRLIELSSLIRSLCFTMSMSHSSMDLLSIQRYIQLYIVSVATVKNGIVIKMSLLRIAACGFRYCVPLYQLIDGGLTSLVGVPSLHNASLSSPKSGWRQSFSLFIEKNKNKMLHTLLLCKLNLLQTHTGLSLLQAG